MPPRRVLHLVWAGGSTPKLDPLLSLQKKNPDLEMLLWVNGKSVPANSTAEHEQRGITVKDINEVSAVSGPPVEDHLAYMIEPERPNFGAASDAIRYVALANLGGLYVDTDVSAAAPASRDVGNDVFVARAMGPFVATLVKKFSGGTK